MSTEQYRKPFEESVAATLALDLERNEYGFYRSDKTANLFIAFCYGWRRGQGDCRSFGAIMQEIAELRFARKTETIEAKTT